MKKLCPPTCCSNFDLDKSWLKTDSARGDMVEWLDNLISMDEVRTVIMYFKKRSAAGLDGIGPEIIAHLPDAYLLKLIDLFNHIFIKGVFPESWKESLVVLIPEADGMGLRLILLVSCIFKTLERCLYHRLRWHVESRGLIPDT